VNKHPFFEPVPGELLGPSRRYEMQTKIGSGTHGLVVRAWDVQAHTFVAVKIARLGAGFSHLSRNEARLLRRIHKADTAVDVVRVLDEFDHCGHSCIVFEMLSMNRTCVREASAKPLTPIASRFTVGDSVRAAAQHWL